jgi:hypothetical protein
MKKKILLFISAILLSMASAFAQYNINLSAMPAMGGVVMGIGFDIPYGTEWTVSAIPHPYFNFLYWMENDEIVTVQSEYVFFVTGDRHLIAVFGVGEREVTLSANPEEGGIVSGGGIFPVGTFVIVTAEANPDFQFINWTENGTVVTYDADYSFSVLESRNLVANFEEDGGKVITILINMLGGEVLGGGTYSYGDEVTIEAGPYAGYKFVNWTEGRGVISTDNPFTFIVTESMLIIANFEEDGMMNIESLGTESILIYPNPTTGEIRVESGNLRVENVEIYSVIGKKVLTTQVSQISPETVINISHLTAGVYFLKISTEAGEVIKKVLKE